MNAYRLVVSLLDETQEYQRYQAEQARSVASTHGCDVEVCYAENTAIVQIHSLYRHINGPAERRPQAIVVETVVGEGLERVAEAAVRAGIGWVLIMRQVGYLDRLRSAYPNVPMGVVGADQLEVGRIQGRQIRALLPAGGGFVLLVQGPPDHSSAQARSEGTLEVLGSDYEVRVVDGRYTEQSGEQAVERWLRLKRRDNLRPALVACQNDHMAMGARRALRRAFGAEADSMLFLGIDGLPAGGQQHVRDGELAATVVMPSAIGPAIESLIEALNGKAPFPSQLVLRPSSFPDLKALRPSADRTASPRPSGERSPSLTSA